MSRRKATALRGGNNAHTSAITATVVTSGPLKFRKNLAAA
jgi:hypothetical protein